MRARRLRACAALSVLTLATAASGEEPRRALVFLEWTRAPGAETCLSRDELIEDGFQPLGTAGEYEYAWVDLTTSFVPASGTCRAGRREAKSDGPFAVTVWGLGYCASYGYAGGAGSRPLTQVEVPVN